MKAQSKKNLPSTKQITPIGKMSNLVGMWALILDEKEKLKTMVYIQGKADDEIYIVQVVSPLDGSTNIAKLINISKMMEWIFLPSREIADDVINDYRNNNSFRFKAEI